MKTVALAIEHFNRFAGGAESYAVSLAQSLIREGWEVHLFGESWDGEPEGAVFHQIHIPRWWPGWVRILGFALEHLRHTGIGNLSNCNGIWQYDPYERLSESWGRSLVFHPAKTFCRAQPPAPSGEQADHFDLS